MKSPLIFRIYKKDQIYIVKQFVDDDRVVIGSGPDAQIDLAAEASHVHCVVEKRGNHFFICDLGSEKGTYKDGHQIIDEPISNGDSFQIGAFNIFFFVGTQKVANAPGVSLNKVVSPSPEKNLENTIIESISVSNHKAMTAVMFEDTQKVSGAQFMQNTSGRMSKKGRKTFAPNSEHNDLKDFLKVGTGDQVEIIVAWGERIINVYHFSQHGRKTLGVRGDISVPQGSAPDNWPLLDLNGGVIINTTPEMKVEILRNGEIRSVDDRYMLQQSEACFIKLVNGMQIAIRFSARSPKILFDSPLVLGLSEFSGLLAALIIAALTGLIVSVSKPKVEIEPEAEIMAKVEFIKPKLPPQVVKPPEEVVPPIAEVKPPEPKKPEEVKVKPVEKPVVAKADKPKQPEESKVQKQAARAQEIRPKESEKKAKIFTSVKQGGSVNTGAKGANAKSKETDVTNTGLLSAFGQGGARSKLDKAYSGTGELLGDAGKATGSSGFDSDRQGDDLGSKVKDTGAGGKGTATMGIAGVGTKGRSNGTSAYGGDQAIGGKGRVEIAAGGSEEAFTGSIDREAVRKVIRSALPQFKACYEREYRRNSKLEGRVFITWEIHAQGVAKNARVIKDKSTINNASVEECVRTRMLSLKFPELADGSWAEVSYPFIFNGQKL